MMNKRETLCDYFDEDVVVKQSKTGRIVFGLVIESSENATDSDDESDTDEDQSETNGSHLNYKWKKLKTGFTKIACYPLGNTLVVNEQKVKLYDRSLLNGDVVQRIDRSSNKLAQNSEHGFCKATKILATLKILGTDRVIENVDCNDVEMLSNITEDTVCLLDSWVGYVKEVNHSITLKCNDGSILIVNDLDLEDFSDLLTQRDNNDSEFNRNDFYIGQQLYGPKKYLRNANWIKQTKQMSSFMHSSSIRNSKINVVVEDISVESVSIKWLCCLSDHHLTESKSQSPDSVNESNPKNSVRNMSNKSRDSSIDIMSHPKDLVIGEEIKRIKCLNFFGKCSLQIGHQCYYTVKATDNIMKFSDWEKKESQKLNIDSEFEIESSRTASISEEDMIENTNDSFGLNADSPLIKNHSFSDSLSTLSSIGSRSSNKKRRKKPKSHFSLPLKQIKKKKLRASQRKTPYFLPINTSVGSRLPVEIVATNTRVTVIWQSGSLQEDIPSVFLYPVHHIDDHDFYPGDFVVENKDRSEICSYGVVQKSDFLSRIATVKWFKVLPDSQTAQFVAQEDVSVYDIKDHPDFNYRPGCCVVRIPGLEPDSYDVPSRAGQVTDLTLDGMLKCVWADGTTSLVYPQELFVIGDYDSDDLWDDSDSDYEDYSDLSFSDNESWQTDPEQVEAASNQTNRSAKKSSKSKSKLNNHSNAQALYDFIHNSATQMEEWLRNGTGNYLNSLQNLIKVFKHAESTLDNNNLSQNQRILNSTSKIRQLSERLMQLLPFSQNFRQGVKWSLSASQSVEQNQSNKSKTPDSENENSAKESETNQSTSDDSPSTSQTNVNTFLKLIDSLKSEILNCENPPLNGDISDLEEKSEPPLPLNTIDEVAETGEVCSTENPRMQNSEDIKMDTALNEPKGRVVFLDTAPDCHKYIASANQQKNPKEFLKRIRKEISLLQTALPDGIDVALFHDRMDLVSVLVFGPKGTPYEDGLFLFDIQLPAAYPDAPPLVHYISYCSDRLNPNLYENGKVCISLLGTWSGKGTEVWSATTSNLLQVIVSIQGLILVPEPYYNEAGYLKQKGTTIANENSRLYNEMVVIKLIQSMTKLLLTPPKTFETTIRQHILKIADQLIKRHEHWASISETCISQSINTIEELNKYQELRNDIILPQFPLLPASYGFCLSLKKAIALFKETLKSIS